MLRARWYVHRDVREKDEELEGTGIEKPVGPEVSLQIELGADYAVLLSVGPDGASVSLWRGSGSHDFSDYQSAEGFGAWCDEVVMAHRPTPQGGYSMEDIVKLRAAADAAMKALWAVTLAARKIGDDESDLGSLIDGLGGQASLAHGQVMERMGDIEKAFAPGDYAEWLQELGRFWQAHPGQPDPARMPFLEWLARRRGSGPEVGG
jgi:hypothetical protein